MDSSMPADSGCVRSKPTASSFTCLFQIAAFIPVPVPVPAVTVTESMHSLAGLLKSEVWRANNGASVGATGGRSLDWSWIGLWTSWRRDSLASLHRRSRYDRVCRVSWQMGPPPCADQGKQEPETAVRECCVCQC